MQHGALLSVIGRRTIHGVHIICIIDGFWEIGNLVIRVENTGDVVLGGKRSDDESTEYHTSWRLHPTY